MLNAAGRSKRKRFRVADFFSSLLEHVFRTLKLHKLSCEVPAFNEPVIGLHKKFGFQVEGVFRDHHKISGNYVDIIRLGLLEREWHAIRDTFEAIFTGNSETPT